MYHNAQIWTKTKENDIDGLYEWSSLLNSGRPLSHYTRTNYKKTEEYFLGIMDKLDNPRKNTVCRFYMFHGEYKKAAKI